MSTCTGVTGCARAVAVCYLQECNQQLEVVEKGLNQFLETKKMAFPRCDMPGDAVTHVAGHRSAASGPNANIC